MAAGGSDYRSGLPEGGQAQEKFPSRKELISFLPGTIRRGILLAVFSTSLECSESEDEQPDLFEETVTICRRAYKSPD